MVSKKKNALYLSVNAFSTKVLIGDTILAPTGDYPWIPRGCQLSRKKRRWPVTDPILGSFENEALENEDRSTKHPNLENEAP